MVNEKHVFNSEILIKLDKLKDKNNWRGGLAILDNYVWVICSIALSQYSLYFLPLTVLIIGARQRALASLLHESSHLVLAKNRVINRITGTFFAGYLIFQSQETYRDSHVMLHHKHLGNPNLDPDYQHYIEQGLYPIEDGKNFIYNHLVKTALLLNTPKYFLYLVQNRLGKVWASPEAVDLSQRKCF